MPRTKGAKTGKFGATINKQTFEGLCSIFCTTEEIAAVFGVSYDTLLRWCKQEYGETCDKVIKDKSELGKVSLRRSQFKMSQTNPTMAIWLGKQYLGQTEKVEAVVDDRIQIVDDVPKGDDSE